MSLNFSHSLQGHVPICLPPATRDVVRTQVAHDCRGAQFLPWDPAAQKRDFYLEADTCYFRLSPHRTSSSCMTFNLHGILVIHKSRPFYRLQQVIHAVRHSLINSTIGHTSPKSGRGTSCLSSKVKSRHGTLSQVATAASGARSDASPRPRLALTLILPEDYLPNGTTAVNQKQYKKPLHISSIGRLSISKPCVFNRIHRIGGSRGRTQSVGGVTPIVSSQLCTGKHRL
jgi:hypothetical protein